MVVTSLSIAVLRAVWAVVGVGGFCGGSGSWVRSEGPNSAVLLLFRRYRKDHLMQQFWVLELLFMETCKEKPSKGKQREKVANNNSKQRCRNSTLIFFLNENNYDNTAINDKWAFLLFLASPTKLLCIFFLIQR